jgi:hypothetical protein
MKKLDYTSLFLSMVSLVWMLTMLQDFSVVESIATGATPSTLAKTSSLVEPTLVSSTKAAENLTKAGPNASLAL